MARIDFRLSKEEKEMLRKAAEYFGFSMTDMVRAWIRYDGNEGLYKAWNNKFG